MKVFKETVVMHFAVAIMLVTVADSAMAQVGQDWLSALTCVAISLKNAVRAFAFVAIIALGLMIMFMELKGWIQDMMKVLFGISIALFAASFLNALFPNEGFGSFGSNSPQCMSTSR